VSKFVSKYNALGDYETGRRLFKSGLLLMTLTGFVAFLTLFFLAPVFASGVIGEDAKSGNTKEDVIFVIRMVSVALIIIPSMSLMRGYFQGFQSMGPTAASQVVEQIVRIVFILLGAFIVVEIAGGSITTAVALATFAAFIGGLGGLYVLVRYWLKRKRHINELAAKSRVQQPIPLTKMYRELITYAIPFVMVGLAIPLYQIVDQFTINKTLMGALDYTQNQAELVYSNVSFLVHKLLMIPVSLSTALAIALVPAITSSYSEGKFRQLQSQTTQALQMVLFLTIPAAVGLSILAFAVYGSLYNIEHVETGGTILRWYAPTAMLLALFSVTAAILQGINQQRLAVLSLLVGVLLKMVTNKFFIIQFEEIGPILATNIGFGCSVLINLIVIRTYANYNFTFVMKRGLLIGIFTALMAVAVYVVTLPIGRGIPESYGQAVLTLIVGVLVGGGCFAWLSVRSNLASKILGSRLSFLKRKKQ
jgi:O-antigen/teichoic acid export membrane protein